jgi:hypothetical protein
MNRTLWNVNESNAVNKSEKWEKALWLSKEGKHQLPPTYCCRRGGTKTARSAHKVLLARRCASTAVASLAAHAPPQ